MTKTFKDYLLEAETNESGLQRYTGIKKYGKKGFEELQKAGREGASEEQKGAIKDKHLKTKEAYSPVQEDEPDMLSDCCGAPADSEIDKDGNAMCSNCKDYMSFSPVEESTNEGPFKGAGKMMMKRKLNKQYKKSDLANFDKSGIDTDGKSPEEIGDMKSDYYHGHMDKADRAKKAKARLSREEIDRMKELAGASIDETYDDDDDFYEAYGEMWYNEDEIMDEAEYQGRKVKLGKPMQGDVKKFKVYVKDPKTGNVKKVNFGHGGSSVKGKAMKIKKSNPARRKSFRARHNCDNPGPRTKARYWSCRKW